MEISISCDFFLRIQCHYKNYILIYAYIYLNIYVYHRQQNSLYQQSCQILRKEFLTLSRFMLWCPQIKDHSSIIGCQPIIKIKIFL